MVGYWLGFHPRFYVKKRLTINRVLPWVCVKEIDDGWVPPWVVFLFIFLTLAPESDLEDFAPCLRELMPLLAEIEFLLNERLKIP